MYITRTKKKKNICLFFVEFGTSYINHIVENVNIQSGTYLHMGVFK